jgi:GTPase SAR1 family protein
MPSFVAVNYQRLLEAQQPQERVRLIVHFYDLLLRMLSIALVSQYLSQDRSRVNGPSLNDLLLNKFPTDLTLDLWQRILFSAFEVYQGKANLFFLSELYGFYWNTMRPHTSHPHVKQTIERLTQIAVGIQSGELPQDEELARESMGLLRSILNHLSFMGRYELIRVTDCDKTSCGVELHRGINIVVGRCSLPNPEFKRGYFYLRKGTGALLRLHPFLMFLKGELEQEKARAADTGICDYLIHDEQLEYLLSKSGKTVVDKDNRTADQFLLLLRVLKIERQGREAKKLCWRVLCETCADITRRQMGTVRDEFHKELYLQRDKTRQDFEHFLTIGPEKRCFVLIGLSGVGKSTFLLAAWEELRLRSDVCILMYDGATVKQSLTEVIRQRFKELDLPVHDIWREIATVKGNQGRLVLLCVDAINENPNPIGLLEELDGLVKGRWPWLKVVFSCRPETWRLIKRPPVKLHKAFYYREQGSDAAEVELEPYSGRLEPFSRQKLPQAYARYQQWFELQTVYGNLSHDVCRTLRDPFNLWLVASTASREETTIPATLKVSELVERYINALKTKPIRLEEQDVGLLEDELVPLYAESGEL